MSRFVTISIRLLTVAGLSGAIALAQDVPLTVHLTSPLTGASLRKGDQFTAQISSPDSLKGDTVRCTVQTAKAAVVEFTVDSLHHNTGVDIPIGGNISGVSNSKGQPGTDEQGRAVHAMFVPAKAGTQTKIGSRFGSAIGGRIGQAVSQADAQSGPSPAVIQIAAQGPGLELGPGSTLALSVRSTGGVSLASVMTSAGPSMAMGGSPASPSAPMSPGTPAAPAATSSVASNSTAAGGQPKLKASKIEFVPGERTVFYDDFSDMAEDEPPPHWKVRGGKVELRTGGNIRELYAGACAFGGGCESAQLTSPSFDIPVNFTFELDWTGQGEMQFHFRDKQGAEKIHAMVRGEPNGNDANIQVDGPEGKLGGGGIHTDTSKPVHFALWAQQGRVRAYLNGERIVDANQVQFPVLNSLNFTMAGYRPNGVRLLRIAESAPDFSTAINATGKYVTHGINFDTDSDRLKPDSAAVLKLVASGLLKNPNLKLEIDGFTDSVGDAAHNLDLSRRRALTVQNVLVSQFGIDAARLTSNGFGPDQPIGSNDTPDGRAANRRVEFVRKP